MCEFCRPGEESLKILAVKRGKNWVIFNDMCYSLEPATIFFEVKQSYAHFAKSFF